MEVYVLYNYNTVVCASNDISLIRKKICDKSVFTVDSAYPTLEVWIDGVREGVSIGNNVLQKIAKIENELV